MTLEYIDKNISNKINKNAEFIKYTFYELRVKENLTEEEMYSFLSLAKTKLDNIGYKVYRTGQKYFYDYQEKIVKSNEILVAKRIRRNK